MIAGWEPPIATRKTCREPPVATPNSVFWEVAHKEGFGVVVAGEVDGLIVHGGSGGDGGHGDGGNVGGVALLSIGARLVRSVAGPLLAGHRGVLDVLSVLALSSVSGPLVAVSSHMTLEVTIVAAVRVLSSA